MSEALNSIMLPIATTCLFSYCIATAMMSVYEMSIDTIMLCFLLDKEVNKGGPYCMGPALKKLVEEEGGLEEFDRNNMKPGESFFFNYRR